MDLRSELISFAKDWDNAMERNNADEIGSFMADDWVIIGTEGGITSKESFLETIRSGDLTHSRMDSDEMEVKVFENTGVIISRGTSAGKYKGQSFELYEWSTSVFIKREGKWSCIMTMLTPANKV